MRDRFLSSVMVVVAAAAAVGAGIAVSVTSISITRASAQAPAASGTVSASAPAALKTPWGEPDLQGIWTDETDTPLQRSPKFANQETFSAAQRDELDKERAALLRRDRRVERGTELDVAGAYNALFMTQKRTGTRTSLIVDPPNGRVPPLTPAAQKIAAAERDFHLALLEATDTCKDKQPACNGGKYDPSDSRNALPATTWSGSIGMMVRRTATRRCAASPAGCPSLAGGPAATGGSCRHQAAFLCSTTSARGKAGSETSSWTGARICRPVSGSGLATHAATGRTIPSSST
jgi:hypothetical protein